MCGILGYIGKSNNPSLTYDITTRLFHYTEIRGKDASGFWAVDNKGEIYYHKEPIKPTEFIAKKVWKAANKYTPELFIGHCREATVGHGLPSTNQNNHPFVSNFGNTALVHNGRINEYDYLKKMFETKSMCDSEILLRIFESCITKSSEETNQEMVKSLLEDLPNLDNNVLNYIVGVKDIWGFVNEGKMAVAIGQYLSNNKYLWLFRNTHRPTWLIDMREQLGQIFFCSTPEIWEASINSCHHAKKIIGSKQKLIELPTEEVWILQLNENQTEIKYHKIGISSSGEIPISELESKEIIPIIKGDLKLNTMLLADDTLPEVKVPIIKNSIAPGLQVPSSYSNNNNNDSDSEDIDISELESIAKQAAKISYDIVEQVKTKVINESLTKDELTTICDNLQAMRAELDNNLMLIMESGT